MNRIKTPDNIVIHEWKNSPYVAKATFSFRQGKKIILSGCMKDIQAVLAWRDRCFPEIPCKIIHHNTKFYNVKF